MREDAATLVLSAAQIELARHALGLTRGRQSYRNHFCCGPGHDDFDQWEAMTAAGAARRFKPSVLSGGDFTFVLTRSGAEAALRRGESLDAKHFPEPSDA
jgi:hypothetical protein